MEVGVSVMIARIFGCVRRGRKGGFFGIGVGGGLWEVWWCRLSVVDGMC